MISTDSATVQLPKSGSRLSVLGSILWMSPARPPICGCFTAKYATAKVPVIVIVNWIESVTSTPHSPDTDAKKIVITAAMDSVCQGGQPSTTLAIFTAARFTVAMITQLKNRPR